MKKKFSIGEVGKIHNLSVQTLRYYDNMGILKPSFVNEESGYRYYSSEQFVTIDLIKQCKAMGLSLQEIKDITENYTSCESILKVIGKQKQVIDRKIEELNSIRNNISFLEKSIQNSLEEGLDSIFIKYYEEREFVKYENTNRFTEEFEVKLSRDLVDIEKRYNSFNKELAFTNSYEEFKSKGTLSYNSVMIRFTEGVTCSKNSRMVVKGGEYLTINFDDDYKEPLKYYKKLVDYIKKHQIKVLGDFYEIYIITRVSGDGKEKSLGKLQILVDVNNV